MSQTTQDQTQEQKVKRENTEEDIKKFNEAKEEFLHIGHKLLIIWEDLPVQDVKNYPAYLPDFEEFLHHLQDIELE